MRHILRHIRWADILILYVIVSVTFIYMAMPYSTDDYWYLNDLKVCGITEDGTYNVWDGLTGCWKEHIDNDNARIANIVGAVLLLTPRWFQGLLTGMAFGLMLIAMLRFLDIRGNRIPAYTILTAMILIFIPWQDHMFTFIYAINYIWGSAIMMVGIWLFVRRKRVPLTLAFPSGLILGAWHEAFAWAALAAFIILLLFRRKLIRPDRVAIIAGTIIGLVWLSLSRGMQTRGYALINDTDWGMVRFAIPGVIYFIIWGVCLLLRRTREAALSDLAIICASGIAAITPLALWVHMGRAIFPIYVLSSLGITYLLQKAWLQHIASRPLRYIFILPYVLIISHMAVACYCTMIIRNEYERALAEYLKPSCQNGEVFVDCLRVEDTPKLALRKPIFNDFYEGWTCANIGKFYNKPTMKVIPTSLKAYDGSKGVPIDGNAGIRRVGTHFVSSDTTLLQEGIYPAMIDYGNGYEPDRISILYFTGADGYRYAFVHVMRKYLNIWRDKVKGIIVSDPPNSNLTR